MRPFKNPNDEMSLTELCQAIAYAEANLDCLKPEYRGELEARLVAWKERRRRLEWTEARIRRTQEAK